MPAISNTPRPGYAYDSTDDVWYPIGTGPHTHADYITSGSAINPNIVDAKGDIIAATAADTVARLAVGANDTVLTADSSTATGLKWATPSSGGMTLITETVASANSSLSWSSIVGTYKQLLLVWHGIYLAASGGGYFQIRFNADSNANYSFSGINADPTAVSLGANDDNATNAANGTFWPYDVTSSTDYSHMSKGYLLIDNYASTSKFKEYQFFDTRRYVGGTKWQATNLQGTYKSTSAITSIDITRASGTQTVSNATNTSIRLYGIS